MNDEHNGVEHKAVLMIICVQYDVKGEGYGYLLLLGRDKERGRLVERGLQVDELLLDGLQIIEVRCLVLLQHLGG
jgi:hypothetical protein